MPENVAVAVSVAEAVRLMLEKGSFSQEFSLARSYGEWDLSLEDTETLRVDVANVSTKQEVELAARGGKLAYTIYVDVAVRKKLEAENTGYVPNELVDPLMHLVQELHAFFVQERLRGNEAKQIWKEDPRIMAAPVLKHLREMRQFTGLIRLVFRATP